MKSPLDKLKFKLHKGDARDKKDFLPSAQLDELAQASQDMQDMRNCYDSLLSAAAATANSAYEFSESLHEMGSCLQEKTALLDDKETGEILSMLGNVQFELLKLVDCYRSHIFDTITNPSESLLNELRTVEDMKRQCDEKRSICEYMVAQQKEKGRLKGGKGESFTLQQLQSARNEYKEEATLCIFRLKSLKQGQSRSLLTQAARHHAAQLNFFRKGLQSLEAVEPHVRVVTEQQHIDYQFSGLEDDGRDGNDVNENRELSFEYRANKQGQDAVSASRNSMEVDEVDLLFPQMSTAENAELNLEKNGGIHVSSREPKGSSHSAPILPERKSDPVERFRQMQQPTARKSNAYVLPTPLDAKGAISSRAGSSVPLTRPMDLSGGTHNLSHSSPLEQKKHEKDLSDRQLQEFSILKPSAGQKDSYSNSISTPLPPPLLEGVLAPQPTSPPKVSPRASPPFASSPRISELHELPRPPGNLITKAAKPSASIVHSAPLVRNPEPSGTNKAPYAATNVTSRLPTPLLVSRSFSIPSSSQRAMAVHVSKLLGPPKVLDKAKGVGSPPVTPIYPANNNPASSASQMVAHSGQIRGGS